MNFRHILVALAFAMSVVGSAGSSYAAVAPVQATQVAVAVAEGSAPASELFEQFQARAALAKPLVTLHRDAIQLSGGCSLGHCMSVCPPGPRGVACVSHCLDNGNCGGSQQQN